MKLHFVIWSMLFFISGCRYVPWAKDVFYQSKTKCTYTALRNDYIRTLRIYDQFTTLGIFDVLWLSDEVRTLYSKEYALLYGYCPEDYQSFLQDQLAESNCLISFYILACVPHVQDILLTEDGTPWSIYLCIDGVNYQPEILKLVELPYFYKLFFGKRYTIAKQVYYISFAAKSSMGDSILTKSSRSLSLCFHTPGRVDECIVWRLINPGRARPCHVDNPDILAYDI